MAKKGRDPREPVEHFPGPVSGPNTTGDADMAATAHRREPDAEAPKSRTPRRATKGRAAARKALPKPAETKTEE